MSDSDDETQANRGSPPFGVNYEMNDKVPVFIDPNVNIFIQEEEDPGSDEELMDTDFNPINTAQNELDDVDVSRVRILHYLVEIRSRPFIDFIYSQREIV